MKKLLTFILLFFFSLNVFSLENVITLMNRSFNVVQNLQTPSLPCLVLQRKFQPLDSNLFKAQKCLEFIDQDGQYGEYGKIIEEYLLENTESSLYSDEITEMNSICPRWSEFSREEKIHFWIYTFASIAQDESTCNKDSVNEKATDGVAVGLLQLPQDKHGEKGFYWRGKNCRNSSSMLPPRDNLRCGLDIMNELMKGEDGIYKNAGGLYGEAATSYWQELKSSSTGGDVGEAIRSLQNCFSP